MDKEQQIKEAELFIRQSGAVVADDWRAGKSMARNVVEYRLILMAYRAVLGDDVETRLAKAYKEEVIKHLLPHESIDIVFDDLIHRR